MSNQKIHPTQLGFDFDGVIADTAEAFIRLACEQYDYCGIRIEEITHFMVEKCLDMDMEITEAIFQQILDDSVGIGLRPMPGAVRVLEELSRDATVTIVTARPEAKSVNMWLDTLLPQNALKRINVVAMGDHDDKPRHVKELQLSHFIDDRAETCVQLNQAGINSIVFDQPWNKDRHTLPTVNSWQDIRALCL